MQLEGPGLQLPRVWGSMDPCVFETVTLFLGALARDVDCSNALSGLAATLCKEKRGALLPTKVTRNINENFMFVLIGNRKWRAVEKTRMTLKFH